MLQIPPKGRCFHHRYYFAEVVNKLSNHANDINAGVIAYNNVGQATSSN